MNPVAPGADCELAVLHDAYQVPALARRRFSHAELWGVLGPIADDAPGLRREEIGRSAEGREIFAVRFGDGPTRVLLWSQMHGDEPTATMALADLLFFLGREQDDPRARRLARELTIVAVPMLNPDGAERFVRRTAYGIDMNTDARRWATPELRALRDLYHRLRPELAFNLHDQNVRVRVGDSDRLAALALLAEPFNEAVESDAARIRAKRVLGVVRQAVEPLVGGHVTRFEEEYEPLGMGEYMQRSGTTTMTLEAGYWPDDQEKQFLRKVTFVALLAALESIADRGYAGVDVQEYDGLPLNGRSVFDLLVRGAFVVVPGIGEFAADVGVDFEAPLDLDNGTVAEIGDLADYTAREIIDAGGLYLHPCPDALTRGGGGPLLHPGCRASFHLRRGRGPDSECVLTVRDGVVQR